MAGIWDRVVGSDSPDGPARLNVSLLETEITGVILGVRTRVDAKANLETELGETLSTAEAADLIAIVDALEIGSVQAKLVEIHKLHFALNAAELQLIDETTFRSVVGGL